VACLTPTDTLDARSFMAYVNAYYSVTLQSPTYV